MECKLYFGQPGSDKRYFGSADEVIRWLEEQRLRRAGQVSCLSTKTGVDGTVHHAGPHRYKIQLPAVKSIIGQSIDSMACDNHIQDYLSQGWIEMAKLCSSCTTSEAAKGFDLCENCLDTETAPAPNEAQRLRDSGYCLNRDQVHGCNHYAQAGSQYCHFCTKNNFVAPNFVPPAPEGMHRLARKPRIRTIPSSTRPCTLKEGCDGQMTASVRLFSPNEKPEVWWVCEKCKHSQVASRTVAIPDPRVREPNGVDMQELAGRVASQAIREALAD